MEYRFCQTIDHVPHSLNRSLFIRFYRRYLSRRPIVILNFSQRFDVCFDENVQLLILSLSFSGNSNFCSIKPFKAVIRCNPYIE